jgi:uncharacterized protein (TIGR03118 family)
VNRQRGGRDIQAFCAKENAMKAWRWVAAVVSVCGLVASCGGGGSGMSGVGGMLGGGGNGSTGGNGGTGGNGSGGAVGMSVHPHDSAADYTVRNLVSDTGKGTPNTDPNLVNGWGIAFNPQGFVWVAANGTSKATLYDGNGVPQSLVVSIPAGQAGPAQPTGIVFSGSGDFVVKQGDKSGPAAFIFAGQAGTLAAWSPGVNLTNAITVYDGAAQRKIYTGLTLAQSGGANQLYAADFRNRHIDVFNASFHLITAPGGFVDPDLPAGYAPFGIQALEGRIYVAYAQQSADGEDEQPGPGLGVLDVFDTSGNLIRRLVSPGGPLNAPWGMALAPGGFGKFSRALLVGNFGDGLIHAFELDSGAMRGVMSMADGNPVRIDGLWGIAFGNGLNEQPTNTLFFAAGPDDEEHGLYGRIDVKE